MANKPLAANYDSVTDREQFGEIVQSLSTLEIHQDLGERLPSNQVLQLMQIGAAADIADLDEIDVLRGYLGTYHLEAAVDDADVLLREYRVHGRL
jgi:hypothetical protein